ncbi:MAG: ABC transporter ATP-binding protein [Clostridia bacterium]
MILEVKNLTKTYNNGILAKVKNNATKAVSDVSFNITEGEIVALLGPNGAGKSTIMKSVIGLVNYEGEIQICGSNLRTDKFNALKNIGAIIETPTLYANMTGLENLKYLATLQGGLPLERIMDIVKLVGMEDKIKQKFSSYSLGMKQRVGIAAAIMHKPKLLILDEPTNGLDPQGILEIRQILRALAHDYGITILISSHNLLEMQELCTRFLILQKGELLKDLKQEELSVSSGDNSIVCISCDEPQKALQILAQKFECKLVIKDNKLYIQTKEANIPEITKTIVLEGISVFGVQINRKKLEDTFSEITTKHTVENVFDLQSNANNKDDLTKNSVEDVFGLSKKEDNND